MLGSQSTVRADYRAAVLADGPIGYWSLDEGSGTAQNLGSLGATANGEYIGEEREVIDGPDLPGMPANNKAMNLTRPNEDGSETPLDVTSGVTVEESILSELTAFTLEGWIRPSEADLSNRAGLFGQDNAIEFGFIGANDLHFWAELPGGGDIHINAPYEFENDEWHHLAVTSDGATGEVFLYLDGEEVALTFNNSQPLEDLGKDSFGVSDNPFNIGAVPGFGADRQYAGGFDEVAAFDKYLTAEQIMAHYQAAQEAGGLLGDFDNSGVLDAPDVNQLTTEIASGANNPSYDVTNDNLVNGNDLTVWVKDLKHTWIGDADLNGEFNSGDLVGVFTVGKYETGSAATWTEGDWDGNGRFNSTDFVAAFTDGGYELGPRPAAAVAAIPEPASVTLLVIGVVAWFGCRRRVAS
jgi:hypothetical protein